MQKSVCYGLEIGVKSRLKEVLMVVCWELSINKYIFGIFLYEYNLLKCFEKMLMGMQNKVVSMYVVIILVYFVFIFLIVDYYL